MLWKLDLKAITSYLLKSLNLVLNKHIIPIHWTKVRQFPIYKSGDPKEPTNYRFISILNSSFKIFTAILNSRLMKWIETNGKLQDEQYAFRPKRGTDEPIFILNMLAQKQLNKKAELHCAFLDLTKAFDSINHELLWSKLYNRGISTNFIELMSKIYKELWIQYDELTPIKIERGVLQGDCLSPTLFNLFLSDLTLPPDWGIPLQGIQ